MLVKDKKEQRTLPQNKAMYLFFEILADTLNEAGLDMKKVLKPGIDIPWTKESVKRHLWKPIQEVMMEKESTTEMSTADPEQIYQVLDRHLSEKFSVHVEWPCKESQYNEAMGRK